MSQRIVVGPFNRVEGDLEVTLDFADGRVSAAYVNSPMFRGFEQILIGKHPLDALYFVPRICGICSVAQSAAASTALAQAAGLTPCENGRISAALTLAIENIADHVSHFFLFFMPDFARTDYAGRAWYEDAHARFKAIDGSARRDALPARARLLESMGLLAGRWPHTGALQPGGSTRPIDVSERLRVYGVLRQFRTFLESSLFGDALEVVAALDSVDALQTWADAAPRGDFGRFIRIANDLDLWRLGRATDRYLSYGAYALPEGVLYPAGVWHGAAQALRLEAITEDHSHAWMSGDSKHPRDGVTVPQPDKPGAYSWCKAPRLDREVVEVGALARQVVAGHGLARDMIKREGGSVAARVVARLLEIARTLPEMERWAMRLQPDQPFCSEYVVPRDGDGVGLVEAARGALGHWVSVRRGLISRYQIIAPTTWNFSPRDADGVPGALEQALAGVAAGDRRAPVAIQHIVRSFDPCMVCTVH